MKILFHVPHLSTIYAGRTIYASYKRAFEAQGHEFKFLTADAHKDLLASFQPDILFTSINDYFLKFLDIDSVLKAKNQGMKVFINCPFWKSPMSKTRINEASSLSTNKKYLKLVNDTKLGDIYYNSCDSSDGRMQGFEKATGYKHHTVLLAADKHIHFPEISNNFKSDIAYIGTNLPGKRQFISEYVDPLRKMCDVRFYGQDWSPADRIFGLVQRLSQYLNIPYFSSLQQPQLKLEDERKIYSSSLISINIHEDYQKEFGGDLNERTFKIPACAGFQVTDYVSCIEKYFIDGIDIVIARNRSEWFEKINHYIKYPEKRVKIIEAGRKKVLSHHTYDHRVKQLITIYEKSFS